MKISPIKIAMAFLFLTGAAGCALPGTQLPGSQADPAGSLCSNAYYPVKTGTTWEYRITVHQPEIADTVLYQQSEIVEVMQDGFTVFPNISQTGEFEDVPEEDRQFVRWECHPEGLFLPGSGREGITVAKDMQPGSTWTTSEPGGEYEIVYTVEGSEQVEVPAGAFEALKVRVADGGEGQNIFKWYAPGVGVVREYAEFEGLDTWTLIELLAHSSPN